MKKSLKEKYINVVAEYIKVFEKKQNCELESWVSDDVGGIASFGDVNYFSFDDIRQDIDNDVPKGLIFDWINDNLEFADENREHYINYFSYFKGLRHKDLNQ